MPHNSRRLGSKIQPSTDLSACVGMACGRQPVAKCGMCLDGNTAWGHRTVEVWGVWYSQAQICHADISYCYITECGKLHVCKQGLIAGFLWCKVVVFCCFWWMKWTFLPALTFTPTLLTHTHTHTQHCTHPCTVIAVLLTLPFPSAILWFFLTPVFFPFIDMIWLFQATNQMKWRLVYSKMGLPPSNSAAHQIKNAYKK